MKLIDAHIHLSDTSYSEYVDELVREAEISNILALVSNSIDFETSINNLRLAEVYPSEVYPALGIHPGNVNFLKENELEETLNLIREQNQKNKVFAIGEIGLDHGYEAPLEKQLRVFESMLSLAEKLGLPVIIHSRGTTNQIVDMLASYNINRILLHWFSHPLTALSKALERGYFISEGPSITYSNGIRNVVKTTPLANLLTETDGPVTYHKFPFNSKLTRPIFVRTVVEEIAKLKNMTFIDVADQIANNFESFFNVKLG